MRERERDERERVGRGGREKVCKTDVDDKDVMKHKKTAHKQFIYSGTSSTYYLDDAVTFNKVDGQSK